jgi:cellulose synthase (UDP-forming)
VWNRGRYGPAALMTKSLYGWSHLLAVVDIIRGKRLGWQTTGARGARPTQRLWRSIAVWSGSTATAWLGLAAYRMVTMRPTNFVFLLGMGAIYATTCVVLPFYARAESRRHSVSVATPAPETTSVSRAS